MHLELICCYIDKFEDEYLKACEKINCWAIPFDNNSLKEILIKKCKVTEYPTITIISPLGDILNYNAYEVISADSYAYQFPWTKGLIYDFIDGDIVMNKKIYSANNIVKDKIFGIYLSASWCEDPYYFTEKLKKIIKYNKKNNIDFPIIFFCYDEYKPEFISIVSSLECYYVPFCDNRYKTILPALNITDLPVFMLYDQVGDIKYKNAMNLLIEKPYNYPWDKPIISKLSTNIYELKAYPCFIFMLENDIELIKVFENVVKEIKKKNYGYLFGNINDKESVLIRMITNQLSNKFLLYLDYKKYSCFI